MSETKIEKKISIGTDREKVETTTRYAKGIFYWITVWIVLFAGEPDLVDSVIDLLQAVAQYFGGVVG